MIKKLYVAIVLALAMTVSACSSGSGSASTDVEGPSDSTGANGEQSSDSLTVAMAFAPDAGLAIDTDDALTLADSGTVEGLVKSNADGEPKPALAESWTQVDETTWEFKLRGDVTFHDGTSFEADAVVTAFEYLANSATPPRTVKGIGLAAEAVDAQTVRVTTENADPILPIRLSSANTAILSPAAYETETADPIGHGTGPFEIVAFEPDQSLTVKRYEDYWGEKAKLSEATLRFLPDASSRAAAIRSGEVDIAEGIALADLEAIEQDDAIRLETFSLPRTTSLYTNTSSGPMSNPSVREAVNLTVDKTSIAEQLLEGEFIPATSYFGPENAWLPGNDVPNDPDQAKKVLEEAGFSTDGSDPGLAITLWTYPDRPELEDIAVVVQAQLEEVGFSVELTVGEYSVLEPQVLEGGHDLFVLSRSYYLDVADPGAFLDSDFTCEGGYNLNAYCSDEFDALMTDLAETTDLSEREALFASAATLLSEETVGIPIAHNQAQVAVSEQVEGYVQDPFERTLLTPELSLG